MSTGTITASVEGAVPLSKAAALIPGRPHLATIWRWATRGVRGVRLATVHISGRRMTTPQAIEEFLAELNAGNPATQADLDADAARRAKQAGDALGRLGA